MALTAAMCMVCRDVERKARTPGEDRGLHLKEETYRRLSRNFAGKEAPCS